MGVPRRTNYTRYDVRTLEEIIKPELLETWNPHRDTYTLLVLCGKVLEKLMKQTIETELI